jgi:DNA repair protein RecN (Recombination protein N)
MLIRLKIENFAVVKSVTIDFCEGLNIITGETGAGKSILIGGINLFLNQKIPQKLIRAGSNHIAVEALFESGGEQIILKREQLNKKGAKSISYINNSMVPFNILKEEAEKLLNIYSQNQHIELQESRNQLEFLDLFSDNRTILSELSRSCEQYNQYNRKLLQLKGKIQDSNEKISFLNYQIEEINSLKMERDEDLEVEKKLKILSSSEEIITRSNEIINSLYRRDNSVYSTVFETLKSLEFLVEIFPELKPYQQETDKFYNSIPDLTDTLSSITHNVEFNEHELNELESKLNNLSNLRNKYHLSLNELLKKKEKLLEEKELYLNIDHSIEETQTHVRTALNKYQEINTKLRKKRQISARQLETVIEKELKQLEIKMASFEIKIHQPGEITEHISAKGTDQIDFFFTSNPGQPPGRLKEIASGGELSRIMLVLMSIVWKKKNSTYIFDEIDTGIGGTTAEFVGSKLKQIAGKNQVICISHLPQISAFADSHFLVTKSFKDNQTFSQVQELSGKARVLEIARLMAGEKINEDILKAASNLIRR